MDVNIADAVGHLDELVRRAEQGEEIVLTRDGRSVAQLGPIVRASERRVMTPEERWAAIDAIVKDAAAKAIRTDKPGHNHDELYDDESGLPK